MNRIAIFIDGGYLDKVLRNEFNATRIDYTALAREISSYIQKNAYILRTYYYHCLPFKSNPPTQEENNRFAARHQFYDALDRLPRFEVKLGRLARRGPDRRGKYFYEQKMVDVLLSVDLVRLSAKSQITDVVLIAGDSDFVPAIKVAKNEGVTVWLLHGDRPHNELWEKADERIKITEDFLNKIRI